MGRPDALEIPLKVVVVCGLPGAGKSSIADALAREFSWPVFSVDPLDASMRRGGVDRETSGFVAYDLALTMAREHLRLGLSAIIDATSPVAPSRDAWTRLASDYGAKKVVVEIVCSDEALHRQRVEGRTRNIPGFPELTWDGVRYIADMYEPLDEDRLVLDSVNPLDGNIERAVAYVRTE